MPQRIGQRPRGGLAGRIGGQLSTVDPGDDRQDVEQATATVRLEHRRKGLAHAKHGKEVRLEDAPGDVFAVGRQEPARLRDARVVDQQRHIRQPAATAACTSAGWLTSSRSACTPGRVTLEGFRAAAYTLRAPRASKARQKARPMPRLAPVTRTTSVFNLHEVLLEVGGNEVTADQRMETTTLPLARPPSTCARASLVDANGYTLSITGRMAPASTSPVISRSWLPSARMKRKR